MAGLIIFNVFLIFVILFKTLPCLPTSLWLIPVFIPWSSLSGLPTFPLWVPVLPLNYLFPATPASWLSPTWPNLSLPLGILCRPLLLQSPWKRGLGHNEIPNGILGQSLCRTWKKPGLLLRHIQSLTECFYPMPPTYSSSTKHKQARWTWLMGGWPAKFWTWVDITGYVPGHPFPTVTSGLLLCCSNSVHGVQGGVREGEATWVQCLFLHILHPRRFCSYLF